MSHDPGDEHRDSRWVSYLRHATRCTGVMYGLDRSLFWETYQEVGEDQDGGDEDDWHNYLPSVNRCIGLRLWAPRNP